ncbi:MAG: P1 family peptidase [Clostridiales Family XIII bacterium]|jgi:L-aminopeptidase/D-esterase-like protein|nr:P1 family peptidase [Clostridiales Family XIII bacterium]
MKKARARDLGIVLPGTPGLHNAITDVSGVEVGFSTVIIGEPQDYKGPGSAFARTGVTAVLPRGKRRSAVFAGRCDLNGNGELTGTHWIDDSGFMHGPLMITNTNSVGVVRDTVSKWMLDNGFYYPMVEGGRPIEGVGYFYPTVGETWDGTLNDTNGFHVKAAHALEALENAKPGPVAEGNVGGGTGMQCHEFKGGTGTASRVLTKEQGGFTVGALVQANHGFRAHFEILGVPMADKIKGCDPILNSLAPKPGTGSVIVALATDAPLLPRQLSKMCRRAPIGIGKLGAGFENGSGDIFLAFSSANENAYTFTQTKIDLLGDDMMDPIYKAAAEAVEEAILNALCAAETMTGIEGNTYFALPHEQVVAVLDEYGKIRR